MLPKRERCDVELDLPSFEDGRVFHGSLALRCPDCGESTLHHRRVDWYWREEDAETGDHHVIERDSAASDGDMTGNPSPRRTGFVVEFYCECCGEDVRHLLTFTQHKGATYIGWTR